MNDLKNYLSKMVAIELVANKSVVGKLVEVGSDVFVIYNGRQFFYIPLKHIILIRNPESNENENDFNTMEDNPFEVENQILSLKDILSNAKGLFVEIYVTMNQSIYGYITNILDDYVVFYSPSHKSMFIKIDHIKWLIPHLNSTAYSIQKEIPTSHDSLKTESTFVDQLQTLLNKVIIFDQGKYQNKIGLLKKIDQNIVEIVSGNGQVQFLNIEHIKMVQNSY